MSAEVADVLRDALALIEDEKNWCQKALSRDTGNGTAYCALGVMAKVTLGDAHGINILSLQTPAGRRFMAASQALRRSMGTEPMFFNNERTHAEVIAAFKDAIVAEEWSE